MMKEHIFSFACVQVSTEYWAAKVLIFSMFNKAKIGCKATYTFSAPDSVLDIFKLWSCSHSAHKHELGGVTAQFDKT